MGSDDVSVGRAPSEAGLSAGPADAGSAEGGPVRAVFDFTLDPSMWEDLLYGSTAYGRARALYFQGFTIFFGGLTLLVIFLLCRNKFDGDGVEVLLISLGITLLSALCGFPLWPSCCWVLVLAWNSWPQWFDFPGWSGPEGREAVRQFNVKEYGPRWLSRARLLVDESGVELLVSVRGEVNAVRSAWADLDCVRVTPRSVVLSPSARYGWSMDLLAYVPFAGVAGVTPGAVVVDRRVLSDVDGFVAFARARMALAKRGVLQERYAGSGGGRRRWWDRFMAWLWEDDRLSWRYERRVMPQIF